MATDTLILMSPDEIDRFSTQVSPAEIELMREQWQKFASPLFDDLIDAGSTGGPEPGSEVPDITLPGMIKQEPVKKGGSTTRVIIFPNDT